MRSIQWLTIITTLSCWTTVSCKPHNGTHSKFLILGAGMAGLSAAKTLTDHGETSFRILEGSERIGGRVKQMQIGGKTVEVGAQWLHDIGIGDSDPILDLAQRSDVESRMSNYDDNVVFDEQGNDVTASTIPRWNTFYSALDRLNNIGEYLIDDSPHMPDISQRAALTLGGWYPQTGTDYAIEYLDTDFNYGQPPETTSTRYAYGGHDEELVLDQDGGLFKIVSTLLADIKGFEVDDLRLRLNTKVESILHTDNSVVVMTEDGTTYTCDYAIVTFSLGVLKHGSVTFEPSLPKWKEFAIAGSTYVTEFPIYLKFPSSSSQFWGSSEYILYGSDRRGYYTVWQNFDKFWPDSRILQVQLSGPEAMRVAKKSDAVIQHEVMTVLRTMFGNNIPDPQAITVPRWLTDPFFRGSYSDWSPSFPQSSHDALRAPVGPVYFAGEAYDKDWFGYLQGAYLSGKEVTNNILSCISDSSKCEMYTPPYEAQGCTYKQANNFDPKAQVDDGSCDITVNIPANNVSPITSFPIMLTLSIFHLLAFVSCS